MTGTVGVVLVQMQGRMPILRVGFPQPPLGVKPHRTHGLLACQIAQQRIRGAYRLGGRILRVGSHIEVQT